MNMMNIELSFFVISGILIMFMTLASPLPLWQRSKIYGKKSIFAMTSDEFRISRIEKERDQIRFCILLIGIPSIVFSIIILISHL